MQAADVVHLIQMPIGRKLWTIKQLEDEATTRNMAWALPHIATLKQGAQQTWTLEQSWKTNKHVREGGLHVANSLDPKIDSACGAIFNIAHSMASALDASSPLAQAATTVLTTYFPLGLGEVTRQPMIDQHADVEAIIEGLRTTHAAEAALLNLEPLLLTLEALMPAYGAALGAPTKRATTFSDLQARRAMDHSGLALFAARLLVRAADEPAERADNAALWAILLAAQEATRADRARSGRDADVDPNTGAPVLPAA